MNVDLHSHFFPVDAFLKAEKYSGSAPKIIRDAAGCAVVSPAGRRGNLLRVRMTRVPGSETWIR